MKLIVNEMSRKSSAFREEVIPIIEACRKPIYGEPNPHIKWNNHDKILTHYDAKTPCYLRRICDFYTSFSKRDLWKINDTEIITLREWKSRIRDEST